MADILIRGMEMPKNCHFCELYEAEAYWCRASKRDVEEPFEYDARSSFCTLIALPERHGRLVDADVLSEQHRIAAYENDGGGYGFHITAKAWVDTAPTIVPAEKEDAE